MANFAVHVNDSRTVVIEADDVSIEDGRLILVDETKGVVVATFNVWIYWEMELE